MISFPRLHRRKILATLGLLSIFILAYVYLPFFQYTSTFNSPSLIDTHNSINFTDIDFELSTIDHKPIYEIINDTYQIEDFIQLPLADKCQVYFTHLLENSTDWKITKVSENNNKFEDENLNEFIVNLNVYNSCFMGKNFNPKIFQSFPNIDQKFNPFLSGFFPLFQHWNGDLFYGPQFKTIKKYNSKLDFKDIGKSNFDYDLDFLKHSHSEVELFDFSEPYWKFYKDNIKGSGISISISDNFIDHTLLLLSNLRSVHNKLPIQLVHRNDLSSTNKLKLVKASRNEYKNLPKLDIWFVDVSLCLNNEYRSGFHHFFNKLLSYTFTSYESVVLLDADVVLFQNPSNFFKTTQYLETDTLFFKDRNMQSEVSNDFVEFLKRRLPSNDDHIMFGINPVKKETLSTEFFKHRYYYYMEAGIVVINRSKFWNGIFTTLHLSLFSPITNNIWGDKELYWISLLLSGLDNYKFNDNWAGSVGTPLKHTNKYYHKICSSHPAHILSDTDELAWLNSGVLNCKRTSDDLVTRDFRAIKDRNINLEGMNFNSPQDLREFYDSPISFDAAIIPPNSDFYIPNDQLQDSNYKGNSWFKLELCDGYIWCVVDTLGDGVAEGSVGKFIIFDEEQRQKYEKITNNYINFM